MHTSQLFIRSFHFEHSLHTPQLKSLHWLKITQRIQYKILSLTYKSLQYNKPSPFFIFSPYNQLVLPTHLQLFISNALQILLGSKFLTDLSIFKLLLFGMLYHTIFALILLKLHYHLSLSSSQFHKQLKTHFFLRSYPPSPISLLD